MPQSRRAEPVVTTEVVFPQNTNHYGTLFGGQMLSWMDKVAYYASARFCGHNTVTVSVENIDFSVPIRNGDILDLHGRVIHTGRSSMVVKVDVFKAGLSSPDERLLTNTGYFTFVALDETGRPRPVPPLLIETDAERELDRQGSEIRKKAQDRRGSAPEN